MKYSAVILGDTAEGGRKSKKKTEIRDQLKRLTKTTNSKPLHQNIDSHAADSAKDLMNALRLALCVAASLHTKDKSKAARIERLLKSMATGDSLPEEPFSDTDLCALLGVDEEGSSQFNATPYGFMDTDDFKNLHSHSGKLFVSSAPGLPPTADVSVAPAVGITSRSYGFRSVHHARNNVGTLLNIVLNQYIEIDNRYYRVQALLLGDMYPELMKEALLLAPPCFHKFVERFHSSIKKQITYDAIKHVDSDYRTITLPIGPAKDNQYINISPAASIEFIEDFHNKEYEARFEQRKLNVGDGNAINIGQYASNRSGAMTLFVQPNPNNHRPRYRIDAALKQMLNRNVLSQEQRNRWSKKKHAHESAVNFKERQLRGYRNAVQAYYDHLQRIFRSIENADHGKVTGEQYEEAHAEYLDRMEHLFSERQLEPLWALRTKRISVEAVALLESTIFWDLYQHQRDELSIRDVKAGQQQINQLVREVF